MNDEEEFKLPRYDETGNIFVQVLPGDEYTKWEFEVIDYDGCAFWINEGIGFNDWLNEYVEFNEPGNYLIKNVIGSVHTDYFGETDEDWESDPPVKVGHRYLFNRWIDHHVTRWIDRHVSCLRRRICFGFKSKKQLPFFLVWREYLDDTGEVEHAKVIFNSIDWIGV